MSPEKNVVEAARAVVKEATHIHRDVCPIRATLINNLESALSAYDSEPAPSEDRVREAVRAVFDAIHGEPNVYFPPPDVYARCAAALKPYVTPAPALPEGTVAVEVSLLKRWRVAMSRCIATNGSPTHNLSLPEIDALLPPPKPEPSAELVAEWEREGLEYAKAQPNCHESIWPTLTKCYVAGRRAEWDAKGGA